MDTLRIFLKEIFAGKLRLLLTIIAIAWGTTTITLMLSVGEGLRQSFGKAMNSVGSNFLVITPGQTASQNAGQSPNETVFLTQQDIEIITRGIPHIHAMAEYNFNANVDYQGQPISKTVNAVYPEYAALRKLTLQPNGRFINQLDIDEKRHVIVLGSEFAKEFMEKTNQTELINKSLLINHQPYRIIGIVSEKPAVGFYQMPDNYLAWTPASTYVSNQNPQTINNILIFPDHNHPNLQLKTQIKQLIARQHHLDPKDESVVNIMDIRDMQEKTQTMLTGTEIFLGLVGMMTLVVAAVGIVNVMFISVRRATREIGIRMAIGARAWQILWRYIFEALIATFIGGAIGIIFTCLLIWGIDHIPLQNKMFELIGKPTPVLSGMVVVIVIGVLGCIGIIAGFFPAKRAAQINPAEALRHE